MVSSEVIAIDRLERTFAEACERLAPMRAGASLLLGCSAGGDSIALLDLCARAAPARGWNLAVGHFDHAQRPESEEEAAFVEARCRDLGLPFRAGRLQTERGASPLTEERLREARIEFFKRLAAETGSEALVLAHQRDDRAEGFLLRLLSGSGPKGLSSIRGLSDWGGLAVARPLLGLRRAELRRYLAWRGLKWRDDPTNEDCDRDRAWVRHRLLPMLDARKGADVAARIAQASELIEASEAALDPACRIALGVVTQATDAPAIGKLHLRHEAWRRAKEPLRRALMRRWLWGLRAKPHPPGFGAVDSALQFAHRGANGGVCRTIGGMHLLKRDGWLIAYPPGEGPPERPDRTSILKS